MRRNFCQACSFAKDGVKTRIAIPHTCAGAGRQQPVKHQYVPKREELDKYLARLKELMEPAGEENVPSPDSDNAELQAKKLSNEQNTSDQI